MSDRASHAARIASQTNNQPSRVRGWRPPTWIAPSSAVVASSSPNSTVKAASDGGTAAPALAPPTLGAEA